MIRRHDSKPAMVLWLVAVVALFAAVAGPAVLVILTAGAAGLMLQRRSAQGTRRSRSA
ncbi:hypothetical protein [Actinoplanes sp. NPDC051494]|uniref:hypothetical protein n=1 Tax=Actinoplanes sp. NPDC051494 TaxID=3363907 RepID=UPI0037AC61A8